MKCFCFFGGSSISLKYTYHYIRSTPVNRSDGSWGPTIIGETIQGKQVSLITVCNLCLPLIPRIIAGILEVQLCLALLNSHLQTYCLNLLNTFLTQRTLSASTTSFGSKTGKFPACYMEKYITAFTLPQPVCLKGMLPPPVLQELFNNDFYSFCPLLL